MLNDIRYAFRQIRRSIGFSTTVIVILAAGLGANIALFSLMHALVFQSMPGVRADDGLMWLTASTQHGSRALPLSYPAFAAITADTATFQTAAAFAGAEVQLADGGEPIRLRGEIVSNGYWRTLGTPLAIGRAFTPAEDLPADAATRAVAIIGYRLWQQRYHGDRAVLGRLVAVNGVASQIVGVASEGFNGPDVGDAQVDVWVPIGLQPFVVPDASIRNINSCWLSAAVRLAPGVSAAHARSVLSTVAARLSAENGRALEGFGAAITSMHGGVQPGDVASIVPATALATAVALLILIVCCTNVAAMLVSRGVRRRREVAIRLSLGATRFRIVRQLLTETLVLALAASGFGLVLAYWVTRALATSLLPTVNIAIGFGTVLFAISCACIATLACAVLPTVRTTRDGAPSVTLKAGASDGTRVRSRLQRTFVVTQVALSVLLLALAGIFLNGLYRAGRVELGFIADGRVLAGSVQLPAARYDSVDARRFADAVSRELAALPGVVRVASATAAPLGESRYLDEAVPDAAGDGGPARDGIVVSENIVSPSYFATMGVPLAAGRVFDQSDATGGPGVVVVTRDFSQRAWPNQSPLGRFVQLSGPKGPRLMVIGVVNPALVNGAAEKPRPLVYRPLAQASSVRSLTFLIRSDGLATKYAADLRRAIHAFDPNIAVFGVQSMDQYRRERLEPIGFGSSLLAAVGVFALALSCAGLYALIAFGVGARTREIGVRVALGASPRSVVNLFIAEGTRLAVVGAAIGIALSFVMARIVAATFNGVTPNSSATIAVVALVLFGVAVVATWMPARQAAHVDPAVALRGE